ncbi:putative methyltransferase NSUN7 [Periophthalmus magnuspinnatus]|uniref:putative methyltransferase NSUN7 n=1 Tax=Periophthalmus magnuspinnatus TaxID=409849 RepID=UPI00243733D8|nr:putative methyltransferase NSUN7 [Periophthalmus magnuspinnatus]
MMKHGVTAEMEDNSEHLERTARGQTHEGFSDRVYLLASIVFQNSYLEKPAAQRLVNYGKERGLSLPEVTDDEMQRAAYKLAFNSLKYQELLENIILDSSFYLTQQLPDDQMSLVVVMLYDFQDRKFVPRECENTDKDIKEVRDVELHLLRFKTKLAASLARWRIKHELLSIECMLPESVRIKQDRASSLMLYAWVNSLKSSVDEVQSVLERAGFSRVRSVGQLQGKTFCQDTHCEDLLVFPTLVRAHLEPTSLLSNHKLIVQDKACCLGPNAVCPLLQEPETGDVLMAGCFSGLTVVHTASLIAMKLKSTSNDKSTVFVCVGDRTESQREKLQQVVNAMGCKNVKLIPVSFQSVDRSDNQFQKVQVILLAPKSSLSSISNPVEFILQEDGDTELLQDLARGSIAKSKLESLVVQQKKDIDHAMQFPKILSVIYTTYSSYPEENEEVVRDVFEQACACWENDSSQTSHFPFCCPLDSKDLLFTLKSTEHSNGCFMAIFQREVENMAHSESVSPVSPGMWEKLSRRRELKAPLTDNSAKCSQQTCDMLESASVPCLYWRASQHVKHTVDKAEAAKAKKLQHKTPPKQNKNQVRLKRRKAVARSSGKGTSLKKSSMPSPKAKDSGKVLLAKIDSQKSTGHQETIHEHRLSTETVPKVRPRPGWVEYKQAVISLPQVDSPLLLPPRARPLIWIPQHQITASKL